MKGVFIGLVFASAVAAAGYFMGIFQFDGAKAKGFFDSGVQIFNAYF